MKRPLPKKAISCLGLLIFLTVLLFYSSTKAQMGPEADKIETIKYTSEDLRDPFKSPFEMFETREEPAKSQPMGYGLAHLQVQAMVWGSKMPQAIINNTVVKIGEIVQGAEILDIRKEGVYVLYDGRQYILKPTLSK